MVCWKLLKIKGRICALKSALMRLKRVKAWGEQTPCLLGVKRRTRFRVEGGQKSGGCSCPWESP